MFTKIRFYDNNNWLNINAELYRFWNNGDIYFANNRVAPIQTEIAVSKGEWNGHVKDVQHVLFKGYYIQFLVNESYLHSLLDIQSCSIIEIQDPENNIDHTVIIDKIEDLTITSDRLDNGTLFLVSITYRSEKVIINKADSILNTNSIRITDQLDIVTDNFTDFELLPITEQSEETKTKLSDGTEVTTRTISKSGYKALIYLNTSDLSDLEKSINEAKKIELVSNVGVGESVYLSKYLLAPEKSQSGENYNRYVIKSITSEVITEKEINPNETNTIRMDAFDFFTDQELQPITEQGDNTIIELPSGQNKIGAAIIKEGYKYSNILDNTTLADFVKRYQNSDIVEIGVNGGPYDELLERREITIEEVNETQSKVNIFCVTSISRKYFNLTTLLTHTLIITRTGEMGSPWTYYTDFPIVQVDEDPEIETNDNNQGVFDPQKNITKVTYLVTFYVNYAFAFQIKRNFELGGAITIDSIPVLEVRPVSPEKLATDLYKVEIFCLTDTAVYYPYS